MTYGRPSELTRPQVTSWRRRFLGRLSIHFWVPCLGVSADLQGNQALDLPAQTFGLPLVHNARYPMTDLIVVHEVQIQRAGGPFMAVCL